jgi:hypothetical protein
MPPPEWLQSFQEQGFATRPHGLEPQLLALVRARLDRVMTREREQPQPSPGVAREEQGGQRWITGISRIYDHLGPLALRLLGHPLVVETAQAICGSDAIPTHDWMVIKNRGNGQRVHWHQDFVHESPYPAINIGIHFDTAGEDAVRFLPRARGGRQPVERFADLPCDHPTTIPACVPAGGITIHDVTLVHGSPELTTQSRRATLYFEFRHPEMLRDHPGIPRSYIELRRRLFEAARNSSAWEAKGDFDDEERAILAALNNTHSGIEAANYGAA